MAYELETPLKLPAGSKLIVTAHYDNSLKNMHNPGPEKEVYFRDQNQSWDEMFTPFIQYTIDSQDLSKPQGVQQDERRLESNISQQKGQPQWSVLKIAEVVGCLEGNAPGNWMLTDASNPIASGTQSTSLVALKAAKAKRLGNRQYRLLGVRMFNPSSYAGEKVAVKGILIDDTKDSRLNVTSLQMLAASCIK